jgi:putative redox protein
MEMNMSDDWREVVALWEGGYGFTGRNMSGGSIQIGAINDQPGISPMEMLLLGLAGCTGMDIISILEKKREELVGMKISVRGRRADDYPKVYKQIEVVYELWGSTLEPRAVEQAIKLSEEKYCSVGLMLGAVAEINSSYVIHPVQKS